jgi:hypothetical protein
MRTHLFWHGSKTLSLTLDPAKTLDGGLHLGSLEQASMRNHQVLYEVATKDLKTRRCKDEGGNWKNRIREAKSRGFEAIFYLNRYEGVSAARIEALSASGDLDKLDH